MKEKERNRELEEFLGKEKSANGLKVKAFKNKKVVREMGRQNVRKEGKFSGEKERK